MGLTNYPVPSKSQVVLPLTLRWIDNEWALDKICKNDDDNQALSISSSVIGDNSNNNKDREAEGWYYDTIIWTKFNSTQQAGSRNWYDNKTRRRKWIRRAYYNRNNNDNNNQQKSPNISISSSSSSRRSSKATNTAAESNNDLPLKEKMKTTTIDDQSSDSGKTVSTSSICIHDALLVKKDNGDLISKFVSHTPSNTNCPEELKYDEGLVQEKTPPLEAIQAEEKACAINASISNLSSSSSSIYSKQRSRATKGLSSSSSNNQLLVSRVVKTTANFISKICCITNI